MKIVIIGNGGHGKVIKDIILSHKGRILGYLDNKFREKKFKNEIYYGPISLCDYFLNKDTDVKFVVAIGDNQTRKMIVDKLKINEFFFTTLIHPSAVVSPSARIGKGTVIMANTVISADAIIGDHVIVNTGSIIEHDSKVGDYCHISPSATLTGCIQLGKGVHIGAGATIIPNLKIGEWSIIGAGASVINSIPANTTAVGVPARETANEEVL